MEQSKLSVSETETVQGTHFTFKLERFANMMS